MKQFPSYESLPKSATYLGSTEGPDVLSMNVEQLIEQAIEPVFFLDSDGDKHFFELVVLA